MGPLRVVVVMLEPPLPFGKAVGRWYYLLLRGLMERGHRVTAFVACSQEEDIARASELFPSPTYDIRCYPLPRRQGLRGKIQTLLRPYSYMFSREFQRDLHAELASGFDVLHLEQLWSGWVALPWRDRAMINVHFLHEIDMEDEIPTGWRSRLERWLMLSAEGRLLRTYRRFRCLSDRIAERVRARNPAAEISVGPNGLDPDLYPYIPDEARTPEPVITVVGSMNWLPSYSAAVRLLSRLWPELRRRIPEARVQIVGWNARQALSEFLGQPGVVIEENVPDMRPYFERTGVLLYAPKRGSGTKVKVLEAMALGVPVVTTSEGVEGLPAVDGVHAGICEDDAGLIERTVRLLHDVEARNRQRQAGRALVESFCAPGPTLDAIEATYAAMQPGARQEHVAGGVK